MATASLAEETELAVRFEAGSPVAVVALRFAALRCASLHTTRS